MTTITAINRQDLAALAAACKFTDKKRPMLAVVRVRLDADGLRCQSTDSFRAFGYVRADAAPADESAFFDVSVNAAALKSVFGKKAWALVDSSHGPRSAATVTAGNGDALASVVVMPVNAPETCDASAAFIEGR